MTYEFDPLTGDPLPKTIVASESKAKDVVPIRTDLTRDEWDAMADSKLQELLQTSSGSLLLAAIRESKDRLEGKPMQRISAAVITAEKKLTESDEALLARYGVKL